MNQKHQQRKHRRRGVVAIFVALILTGLIGVTAVSLDGGLIYLHLRKARATADAAAMAAACELYKNYPSENGLDPRKTAKSSALNVASSNGYTNDGSNSTVVVNIPPTSGTYAGRAGYVEVLVTYYSQRAFSRIWGTDKIPVKARAVARGAWTSVNAGVIILDYDDKASLNSQGNGAFTETGGPVIVNSNNPSAVLVSGNGSLRAPEFIITGGVQLGGNSTFETLPVPGNIYTGMHPTPDPLAYLPAPAVPPNGTMLTLPLDGGKKLYIMTPGRYTNLPIFGPGDHVILRQASYDGKGIYYIDGGGFKSTGASIYMDGYTSGGVMIYNNPADTNSGEKIQITGNGSGYVNLSPLTNGPYAGLVLWQNRTSPVDVLVEGNGQFSIKGTFYAAGAKMSINGNGTTETGFYYDENGQKITGASRIGSQFISKNLSLGGNGNISILYNGPDAARTRVIALVE